ncbi:MAG: SUMF1/EgtB/PvdO family nonheme iron enzyme [Acidobacteria bacterium]|nr:SUMF1/EgtB/PvdO family nonheme iron enzyme [Acidobacteriota bacterium]
MDKEKTVLTPSTLLQGRYRVVGRLGRGGMAVVYEAVDENLQCRVAVKETFATDAERGLRRAFRHEAQLLANVRHAAFPRVTDYFEQGDGLFFVMDFIHGDDLARRLELMGRPFPPEKVLKWADRLLDALAELHAVSPPIVHKDIKPSNIKLCEDEVYLLDFGLAKGALGLMSTVQGDDYSHVQGYTLHFASPEQRSNWGTTPRSDLYSLGATLWNLLTNEPPPDSTLRNYEVNNGDPDPLRPAHALNPAVPPEVSAVLEQAMSLNPTRRYADAAAMRAALREAVEAPLRAQAERARREEEARTRREGEEAGRAAAEAEFKRQLEQEREAHSAAARRLQAEHRAALTSLASAQAEAENARAELSRSQATSEGHRIKARELDKELASEKRRRAEAESRLETERGLRLRREEEFCYLEDRLKKSDAELQSVRSARDAALLSAQKRAEEADHSLREIESSLAASEDALKAAEELTRKLAIEKSGAVEERRRLGTLLEKSRAELRNVEKERDGALQAAKSAKAKLALIDEEKTGRRQMLLNASVVVALLGVVAGGAWFLSSPLLGWLSTGPPSVTVSDDKLKVTVGDVSIETVKVAGGNFLMGSAGSETSRDPSEKPQHMVTVADFVIGKYEVTQAQWRMVARLPKVDIDLDENPASTKGDDLPVESVSWNEAVEFCARLSKTTGMKYRLPTEAEWEYAARGGVAVPPATDVNAAAWFADNSGKQPLDSNQVWAATKATTADHKAYDDKLLDNGCQPHPVGQKLPSPFGLYDMLGNVWEWCADPWHADYRGAPADGGAWTGDTNLRVRRGGSWYNARFWAHPAARASSEQDRRGTASGLRVARSL